MTNLRLIIDPPADGAWNMGRDEALLLSAAAGRPTLRFYQWLGATLSLGYFQTTADRETHSASKHCPLVRRSSGGGAIVHDRELTYSLAFPIISRTTPIPAEVYDAVHGAIIAALNQFDVSATRFEASGVRHKTEPFLCFERRAAGDLLCGQAKIVGSAQRRHRGAILQHGSILLACSPAAPELPGIAELTGVSISADQLAAAIAQNLADHFQLTLEPTQPADSEQLLANQLAESKYALDAWTRKR